MWRELLSMGRNPVDIAGRMLIFTWVGLAFGSLFYNLGPSFQDLQNKVNLLFVTVLALLLLPYVAISLFLADKQYFIADTNAGLLSPSAYYAAKLVVSTPLVLLNVAVLVLVLYGLVGLRLTTWAFFAYLASCALMYLISAQVSRSNRSMLA
jgi:ABC-type multidrug transport system permease subunit